MAELELVRTGPTSYLKFNKEDAVAWRKTHKEYGDKAPAPKAEAAPRDEGSIAARAVDVPKKKADG